MTLDQAATVQAWAAIGQAVGTLIAVAVAIWVVWKGNALERERNQENRREKTNARVGVLQQLIAGAAQIAQKIETLTSLQQCPIIDCERMRIEVRAVGRAFERFEMRGLDSYLKLEVLIVATSAFNEIELALDHAISSGTIAPHVYVGAVHIAAMDARQKMVGPGRQARNSASQID